MSDFSILKQCLLTCDAPEEVWEPALSNLIAERDALKAKLEEAEAGRDENHMNWAFAHRVAEERADRIDELKTMLDAALDDDWEFPDLVAYRVARLMDTPKEAHLSTESGTNRVPEGVAEAPLVEDGPGRATGGEYQGDAATYTCSVCGGLAKALKDLQAKLAAAEHKYSELCKDIAEWHPMDDCAQELHYLKAQVATLTEALEYVQANLLHGETKKHAVIADALAAYREGR